MVFVLTDLPDLPAALRALIAQVPPGRVVTCGGLAVALGDIRASRWVGHCVLHHDHTADCNCHRVVRAHGVLGGFVGGSLAAKQKLLRFDGVAIKNQVVDLDRFGCNDFATTFPLARLRAEQDSLLERWRGDSWTKLPERLGGVDVSYSARGEAVAAYTVVDSPSGELVWSTTISVPVAFPYIPTYLTYRELPALLAVVDVARQAGQLAELTLVDGTGILHPRRLGVAAHLGIVAGLATVGVTKSLLCGRVKGEPRPGLPVPVVQDQELLGMAIVPAQRENSILYVSSGQGVDLATAQLAVESMLRGRRLPEPIYWADRLSRGVARGRAVRMGR